MKKFPLSFHIVFWTGIFFLQCKPNTPKETIDISKKNLFEQIPSKTSGLNFTNNIIEDENINYLHYAYIYNGGGVAIGDINNDGLQDIYFSSNLEFNKLYLNLGNLKFKDITASAGVSGGDGYKSGVTMVDINMDGWMDIFVCKTAIKDTNYRKKILYINNHDGTFTDRAAEYGLDDRSFTTQAYFFDSDGDGDLDVYFVNHPMNFEDNNYIKPVLAKTKLPNKDEKYTSDRLFENRNGKFIDISSSANIINEAFGLSAVIGDFNNDGKPDIYVSNDFLEPDYLYINQGGNKFKEEFQKYFQHCPFSSMGSDYADINNDDCLDLINVDMTPSDPVRQKLLLMTQNYDRFQLMENSGLKDQFSINSLQLGSCGSAFSDIAFLTHTAYTDWSWSPLIADFDNDGNKDIFITNGYLHDVMHSDYNRYKLDSLEKLYTAGLITQTQWINNIPSTKTKDYFFKNKGNLDFEDVSESWNSGAPSFSHGAAYADLDNDGDLDLVINNVNDEVTLLKNNSNGQNNFIRFKFKSSAKRTNDGVKVKLLMTDQSIQIQYLQQTRGFLSKVEDVLHFGMAKNKEIESAEIIWPDQKVQNIIHPAINSTYTIAYEDAKEKFIKEEIKPLFKQEQITSLEHKENTYIDFKREPLLINKLSEEGPAIAIDDVNNDGLDDIFIGGASSFAGKIMAQKPDGSFVLFTSFDQEKQAEDVAACFLDVNSDGFKDLYVVSGGNENKIENENYQDRIYINNGKGKFTLAKDNLPNENNSGSCITYSDIDKDGDLDIFVGSRSIPGKYPEAPQQMLLINDHGKFSNQIDQLSEGLNTIGMITDAIFADLDNDQQDELIVCGEFIPINIFKKINGKYLNQTTQFGLSDYTGLWQCIKVVDLNGDSYPEIIAGNTGRNSHLQTQKENFLELYYKDFDQNGSIDPILCQKRNNKAYPIHYRDRMLDQMVFLKKKFTRHEPYAIASMENIFTEAQMKEVKVLTAHYLSSFIFINEAGKKFKAKELPIQAQFSTIQGIEICDFNKDGQKDLILVGNFYGTDAQFGQYDASIGCLLKRNADLNFEFIPSQKSGLNLRGNIRGIYPMKSKNGLRYLVSRNNDSFSIIQE